MTDWGDMTFGEVCDEMLAKATLVIAKNELKVAKLRACGRDDDADALEAQLDDLKVVMVDILETRNKTPFERLSDEQLGTFSEMYGLDPDILRGEDE